MLFHKQNFTNRFHELGDAFYQQQAPSPLHKPHLVHINHHAASLLDQSAAALNNDQFRDFACGNSTHPDTRPIAAIYAGHQFGHFVSQLGDGRALLLGEIKNSAGEHWEIQLKGAGMTPYSRQGDGRAVLRSSIREYLCSEAMFGLGIATTRALAMVNSEEEVFREQLETGAVIVRLAPSFIRFGSFELFASRGQHEQVKTLADFVISHYYPDILQQSEASLSSSKSANPYQLLFAEVVKKTALMIAQWQSVGFAHGVMNTDNMSILGLTLDYGPFGFLDSYQPDHICNHSDHQGRYSFKNQPGIAHWNLARLAEALLSLMTIDEATEALSVYEETYSQNYMRLMRRKLGFFKQPVNDKQHQNQDLLIAPLLNLMAKNQVDYTLFFRQLADFKSPAQQSKSVRDLFPDREAFDAWLVHYEHALEQTPITTEQRREKMNRINPKYILRNYMAETAIKKATEENDYSEIDKIFTLMQSPYDEHPDMLHYAGFPPDWASSISLSCSS